MEERRGLRIVLIGGTAFLGVTAVLGGAMLLLGINVPPTETLRGSLFSSFLVPGLVLALAVGGSGVLAAVLLYRRRPIGFAVAAVAGLVVMTFEFVQVISIGSPPGSARAMQLIYFALGLLLVMVALAALHPRSASG